MFHVGFAGLLGATYLIGETRSVHSRQICPATPTWRSYAFDTDVAYTGHCWDTIATTASRSASLSVQKLGDDRLCCPKPCHRLRGHQRLLRATLECGLWCGNDAELLPFRVRVQDAVSLIYHRANMGMSAISCVPFSTVNMRIFVGRCLQIANTACLVNRAKTTNPLATQYSTPIRGKMNPSSMLDCSHIKWGNCSPATVSIYLWRIGKHDH